MSRSSSARLLQRTVKISSVSWTEVGTLSGSGGFSANSSSPGTGATGARHHPGGEGKLWDLLDEMGQGASK